MQEMQEIWVQPLGQEDPLEKGMATHSSILSWRISWTEEPRESYTTVHLVAKSHSQLSNWAHKETLFSGILSVENIKKI